MFATHGKEKEDQNQKQPGRPPFVELSLRSALHEQAQRATRF
ncbi:TPA: hypothetical protein ACKP5P_001820 [Stenotrophomonas maltophilia]